MWGALGKFVCTILGVSQLDPILQAFYLSALFPQHIRYVMHPLGSDNILQYLCRSRNDSTRCVRIEKYTYYECQLYSPSPAQVSLKHTVIPDFLQGKWQKTPSHDIKVCAWVSPRLELQENSKETNSQYLLLAPVPPSSSTLKSWCPSLPFFNLVFPSSHGYSCLSLLLSPVL